MDRRTEQEYQQALDSLRFSSEGKERIMKNLMERQEREPVKGKRFRPLRMALIAAAVCLALVGTAGAAVYSVLTPHLEPNIDGSGRFDGYTVTGKLATYPVRRFSGAFLEAGETASGMVAREFATFDEVRAYLGESIPCTWAKSWESGYTVMLYHNEQGKIWGSDVMSESPDGRASIWLHILTEHYRSNPEEVGPLYGGGPNAVMERLDSYQMPNGCVAETFTIDRTAVEGWTFSTCISFFIKDGNLYEVSVHGELTNPSGLWPEVQKILDSFQ